MIPRSRAAALFLLALTSVSRAAPAQTPTLKGCLHYEPVEVELRGRVVFEQHYGPPNFGEDTLHDEKDTSAVLVLSTPIAVCADTSSETNLESFPSETRLQFVVLKMGADITSLANQHVTVKGKLYEGLTAHYFTHVAIDVQEVRLSNGKVLNFRVPPPKPLFDSLACVTGHAPVLVTTTRVGDFPLDAPLGMIEAAFPNHHWAKWLDENEMLRSMEAGVPPHQYDAVRFMLLCVQLEGSQYTDTLDLHAPVRLWDVMGVGLLLPKGVPFAATWQDLVQAYGPRMRLQDLIGAPAVCFDALPGFEFVLRTKKFFKRGLPIDSIPPTAVIWSVRIAPTGSAPHGFCQK